MARAKKNTERPAYVTPMAAKLVSELPDAEGWLFELKLDGYRALLLKDGPHVEIRSRKENNLTRMYPSIAKAASRLNAETAVVDGEIVALDAAGRPSFQALQHRGSHPGHQLTYYAFDVLHLDGRDLTRLPLTERRANLPRLLEGSGIRLSIELPGTAAEVINAVRALGLEGVIAKRRDSPYEAGERSGDWQKLKIEKQQEFVIGGYRPASSSTIDALLVGYYEDDGLHFAAKVRAGFVPHIRRELLTKLKPLQIEDCPFVDLPHTESSRWGGGVTADEMHEMRWVQPLLVAQIRFVEWTAEGRLRHAAFLGLRADKSAGEIRREI